MKDPAIYMIYPLGNCISASPEMPFLQIGEIKYGKPILDRFVRPQVKLEDAARCALVSLDSTMRSNISVGPPVDVAILPRDGLAISHSLRLDFDTPYYASLKDSLGPTAGERSSQPAEVRLGSAAVAAAVGASRHQFRCRASSSVSIDTSSHPQQGWQGGFAMVIGHRSGHRLPIVPG